MPAFKRLENDLDVRSEWHSQDGPIPIRRHPRSELVPWQAGFLDACAALGFPRGDDANDPTTTGWGPHAMNKVGGERMSVARCYLTPTVRARAGLRIEARSVVRRVLLSGRKVAGVEVETQGRVHAIESRRVVLCAGATATPGILLRSGIGPRSSVERLGVDVVMDLPAVGARLLDHPGVAIFLRPRRALRQSLRDPLIQTVLRYTSKRSAREKRHDPPAGIARAAPVSDAAARQHHVQHRQAARVRHDRVHLGQSAIAADGSSRGCSSTTRTGSAPSRRCASPPTWRRPRPCAIRRRSSGRRRAWSRSDARLAAWIGRLCDSGYHPCGTVPMGADDASDVVAATDGRGRVRGIDGLWVADASLMPTIPSANTNLTAIMMGERFGEWMKSGEM